MHPAPDEALRLPRCELFKLLQITEKKRIYFQKQSSFYMYAASKFVCVCVFPTCRLLSVFGREEAIHRARAPGRFLSAPPALRQHANGTRLFRYEHQSSGSVRNQSAREANWWCWKAQRARAHCFHKKKTHFWSFQSRNSLFFILFFLCDLVFFRIFRLIFHSLTLHVWLVSAVSFIVVSGDHICAINSWRHTGNASVQGFFMCGGISHFWRWVWCLGWAGKWKRSSTQEAFANESATDTLHSSQPGVRDHSTIGQGRHPAGEV